MLSTPVKDLFESAEIYRLVLTTVQCNQERYNLTLCDTPAKLREIWTIPKAGEAKVSSAKTQAKDAKEKASKPLSSSAITPWE